MSFTTLTTKVEETKRQFIRSLQESVYGISLGKKLKLVLYWGVDRHAQSLHQS